MLSVEARQDLVRRLRKIEGQARGIQRMIDEGRDCREILDQLASVRAATRHVGRELAKGYLTGCLSQGSCLHEDASVDDLVALLMRV
jgi:CsoR family transcriptional regulator, copper-sensing transcriptional repressor